MCRSEGCCLPPPPLCPTMPSHQLIQPMKPKLPRKIATSARINLNKYWHVLEELMPVSRKAFDESDSNAINENIDNEQRLRAMQLSDEHSRDNRESSTGNFYVGSNVSTSSSLPMVSSQVSLPTAQGTSAFPWVSDSGSVVLAVNEPLADENTASLATLHANNASR